MNLISRSLDTRIVSRKANKFVECFWLVEVHSLIKVISRCKICLISSNLLSRGGWRPLLQMSIGRFKSSFCHKWQYRTKPIRNVHQNRNKLIRFGYGYSVKTFLKNLFKNYNFNSFSKHWWKSKLQIRHRKSPRDHHIGIIETKNNKGNKRMTWLDWLSSIYVYKL